ncbi:hypothetical protein F4V54_01155 [Corynebacterium tuscaniense]|uniref:hypothetical protein n=2 Tax=Corynebacterium tuscaniense TaxID=302449 RepID=UPI0012385DB8|nr:hypothetical protein [Corynebacterium tuscaniense]KAA8745030.1 hypothetical protein F4V54_01155 [Corynebacterium tuscaniense]
MSNVINELQSLKGLRMKIRKSLLAAATAAVVSVSGVVAAPAFAEETPTTTTTPAPNPDKGSGNGSSKKDDETDKGQDKDKKSFLESFKELSSDKDGNWDPKAITAWIAVFTAVLGLLANVITFVQKNFTQK